MATPPDAAAVTGQKLKLVPREATWRTEIPTLYGLHSNRELARYLDVSESGLWRVMVGEHPPGNNFMARARSCFPELTLEQLFELRTDTADSGDGSEQVA